LSRYFPRHTIDMQAIEPPGFRRLTLSLVEMAVITGVTVRLFRAVVLTYGPSTNLLFVALSMVIGALVLFGMAALHLANFTPRHWVWRAPVFGLAASVAEMVVSALLVVLGREPLGSGRASMSLWADLAFHTIINRTLAVCIFAVALAGVVQVARRIAIARETNPRAAAHLREELFSEAPETEIDSTEAR
jgi:hypothetical protein